MQLSTAEQEFDHDRIPDSIVETPIRSIRPAPENELLYRAVCADDPDIRALAQSIQEYGLKEPLVISLDGYILSGHRRHRAALEAGLKSVPCRIESIRRTDPLFIPLLREYNRQRVKSFDEIAREEVVSLDPEEAHRLLIEHRRQQSQLDASDTITLEGRKRRAEITKAKRPLLDAIASVLEARRQFWPLSVRQVHYALLNDPPLIHASKPGFQYGNNHASYKAVVDIITRARLVGLIPWSSMDDETRTVQSWNVHGSISPFLRSEMDGLLKGYYRDLLQSQPNHIEMVGEKNTIKGIIEPVAMEYCLPLTIGRGYSSLPPRQKMATRFRASGKAKLILLVLSDFDPEGEDIAHSFARSMRDDFGIREIMPIKVALTGEQVSNLNLPPMLKAKASSSRRERFVERHGDDVYELEAVDPAELQRLTRLAIDRVLDVTAFNAEIEAEKRDAAHLEAIRRTIQRQLTALKLEN